MATPQLNCGYFLLTVICPGCGYAMTRKREGKGTQIVECWTSGCENYMVKFEAPSVELKRLEE